MKDKTVGILGGMGPDATVDLMARVIAATSAKDDIDHVHMIVDNNPKVPSRIKALIEKTGESPSPVLVEMAKNLVSSGADFLAMPCNTAHYYIEDIVQAVDVPVINLIALAVQRVKAGVPNLHKVGMLASTAVQMTELYNDKFEKENVLIEFPVSDQQAQVMDLIRRVKRDAVDDVHIENLNNAVSGLEKSGVECLLIACTELSVVAAKIKTSLPIFDASQILAQEIVLQAKSQS